MDTLSSLKNPIKKNDGDDEDVTLFTIYFIYVNKLMFLVLRHENFSNSLHEEYFVCYGNHC